MIDQPDNPSPGASAEQAFEGAAKARERATADAQSALRSGLDAAAEAAKRASGHVRQGMGQLSSGAASATRRSQQSMETAASAGSTLVQGAQEISQAWMDLAQDRMLRMAEGMQALATCRTPSDVLAVQRELMQGAMEQMIETNRRVAEVSMRVMQEVGNQALAPLKRGQA